MKKIEKRTLVCLALTLALVLGLGLFVVKFFLFGGDWASFAANRHLYNSSGALAVGTDLMTTYGPDSYIGRVAAVMLGSTETTFYTIAVYFGSAGIHRTRHAMPAALLADLTGFVASALAVRLLFGS